METKPTTNPYSIAFVEMASGMGGVEVSTLNLARRLDRNRWQPLVICPEEGALPQACRMYGVAVEILPRPALRSTSFRLIDDVRLPNPLAWAWDAGAILLAARDLAGFLANRPPDIIVTKGLLAHFYGGLAARRLGRPCVWHVQDFISERFGGLYRQAVGQLSRWLPDRIVVDGQAIARQLPPAVQSRVSVVYNGIDTDEFRPGRDGQPVRAGLGLPPGATVIGHVARMTPWKGQHYLIEAFARLAPTFPHSYLLLVGSPVFDNDSYEKQLKQQVNRLGLGKRVIFAGYRTDLAPVLAAMDIFAYPSLEKDTSPLALLSAMAAGLPVVAFDIEGIRELIGHKADGWLIPVKNSADMAEAIRTLIENPALCQTLQRQVRQKAVDRFSLQAYTARMETVFIREILQANSNALVTSAANSLRS